MPLAWRSVTQDWRSAHAPAAKRLTTPPGATVAVDHPDGIYVHPNTGYEPRRMCRHARNHNLRVVLVDYDNSDIKPGPGQLQLRKLRVLAEVTPEDVAAIAAGADHTHVVERTLAAPQTLA